MRIIVTVLTVFLLSQLLSAGALAQSGIITTPKLRSLALAEQENWVELEKAAKEWTAEEGANWESWYHYGLAQLRLSKAEEAVKALSVAFKLSPRRNDTLLLTIADSYAGVENWRQAEASYRELLLNRPSHVETWDKLRNVIEQHIKTEPDDVPAMEKSLVEVLKKQLTFGAYINTYDLWLRYTTLLVKMNAQDEARKAYVHVLRLDPADMAAAEWVFIYDIEHADAPTVEKSARRLERLSPKNPVLHIYYAEQALDDDNKRRAREHYDIASRDDKYPYQQAAAFAGLGDLTGIGETRKAMAYYKKAINIDPSYVRGWEQIGVILRSQNKVRLARRYFLRMRQVSELVDAGKAVPRSVLHDIEGKGTSQ